MQNIVSREEKMKQIFETAQQMKKGEIKIAKEYPSVKAFIADAKITTS